MPPRTYREALGTPFDRLDLGVRLAHSAPLNATGQSEVERGTSWVAGRLANLMRLPKSGRKSVTLKVAATAQGLRWYRQFGDQAFTSFQRFAPNQMVETIGPVQFRFNLTVQDGGLHYDTIGFRFLGIPLPLLLSPKTEAHVTGEEGGWHVKVRVTMPLVGLLCQYSGSMEPI